MVRKQQGFTLVEIAIVLIIIGLLLTGILKGQEMITNARINNIVNSYEGLSAAIYSYQDRYGAMPGDDPQASRFDNVGAAEVGDGDGIVDNEWDSNNDANETRLFWLHLRNSGLVAGPTIAANGGTQQEVNAYGGLTGVEFDEFGMNSLVICFSRVAEDTIEIIDIKYDDGDPQAGDIRADDATNDGTPDGDYTDGDDDDENMCWRV